MTPPSPVPPNLQVQASKLSRTMLIKIKILAVLIAITFAGVIISSPRFTSTLASGDRIIEQIKHYKGWKKITPEPFAVSHKSSADESPDIIWFDTSGFG